MNTAQFAKVVGVQPDTLRRALVKKGSYFGITPAKTPNGRLVWPENGLERLKGEPELLEQHTASLGYLLNNVELCCSKMQRFEKNTDGHRVPMFCDEPDNPFYNVKLVAQLYTDGTIKVFTVPGEPE